MTSSRFLMLGLRASGKTTYLASLWHYLEADESSSDLVINLLQPNREYLNKIRDSWLALKPIERTSTWSTETSAMEIHNRRTGENISLAIPDISGETYRMQWEKRRAPLSYKNFAEDCTGALLFIHPQSITATNPINLVKAAPADDGPVDVRIPNSEAWTPTQSGTQVQLVDMLQTLLAIRGKADPLPLAVIISAWDTIKTPIPPEAYIQKKLPLLGQYLEANRDILPHQVYGVSAQGGDFADEADVAKLKRVSVASDRPRAVTGNENCDITGPISYLLSMQR